MVKNPQKIIKDRYTVVPRTLILIFSGDKVLIQKGAPTKKIWAGRLNGLGGHIERGEDVITAARRELMEESGITCSDLMIRGVVSIDVEENQGILLFVLSGDNPEGELRKSEEGELLWINRNELEKMDCVEDIPMIIRRLEVGKFFSLQYIYDSKGNLIVKEGI